TTELGTQQWIERILGASGVSGMTIMALMTSIMCVGRYFGGPLIHRFHPVGVLLGSAIFAFIGIGSMSVASGEWIYVSAVLFAIGVTYFWPTMLGMVAQELPQTGALGLSVMGGAGMFAVSLWNPVIGHWVDQAHHKAANTGLSDVQNQIFAGQSVLSNLAIFPAVLILFFTGLYLFYRKNSLLLAQKVATKPARDLL
ncbi:MAG: MFS family permease, partial [Phenylobacterium sp.]